MTRAAIFSHPDGSLPAVRDVTIGSPRGTQLGLLLPLALLVLTSGCGGDPGAAAPDVALIKKDPDLAQQDHFGIAIDYLKMRDKHNLDRSASQASFHLNKWIAGESADARWMVDRPLINTIPDSVRSCEAGRALLRDDALAKLEFTLHDIAVLEEARWLHAIATMLDATPLDPALQPWLPAQGLDARAARTLATSLRVFDWTIRNIQLEPLLEYPKSSAAGPLSPAQAGDPTANWPPPMRAEPGPGYTGEPWHVLMYGSGDAYQRARVFVLLLRQLRIDAAVLGIDARTGRARPWLPAVLIDGQLYLFDTALGLPIPGPGEQGIATLSQVQNDPSILAALNLGEGYTYPVQQSELDQVVVLLDAAAPQLSQRMLVTEKRLSAAEQMILSIDLARLAERFKNCPAVTDVRLWAVPIEAEIYQQAYRSALAQDPARQRQEFIQHGVFQQHTPIVKGRRCYLLGQFNQQGDEIGAAGHFADSRVTDVTLDEMLRSLPLQVAMGLTKPKDLSDQEWAIQLAQLKRLQVDSKEHASYWLGLSHQQQHNYGVAVNWLKKRTLDKYPDGVWTHGARYNIARCYEAMGNVPDAIQLYRIDESPQRHGNLLRAKYLEARLQAEQQPKDESAQ